MKITYRKKGEVCGKCACLNAKFAGSQLEVHKTNSHEKELCVRRHELLKRERDDRGLTEWGEM